jgi:hypothetical protein
MTNDIRDRLQDTARAVEATLPPGTGFIVLAFDFGEKGDRIEYVANGRREDCLKAMLEFCQNATKKPWGKHCDEPPDLTTT